MRYFALSIPLLALIFLGFGCKEPEYGQTPNANWRGVIQDTSASRPTTNTPPPRRANPDKRSYDNETPLPPEVTTLREAMRNLVSANSFRATLKLPPTAGQSKSMEGELSFNRAQGLRGTISTTPNVKSELLVIQDQVYFRANTSSWENISYTPDADKLQQFFSIVFPHQIRPNQVLISDSARIRETKKDPQNDCTRYTFDEIIPNGEREQTVMCIKNNLPVYIINEYAEGSTEVHYKDINQPVDIGGF